MASKPPPTRVKEEAEVVHGVEIRDRFSWLEAGEAEEVREWVAAQNAYTRRVLGGYPGRDGLAARLRDSLDCGQLSPSVVRGQRRFFTRRQAGMEQASLVVQDGFQGVSSERLLLDPQALAGSATAAIDWYSVSDDGSLAAVGLSEGGDERSTLRLVSTGTGELLPDRIPDCPWAAVAFEPGGSLLYTRRPAGDFYNQHVCRHRLGDDSRADEVLFRPAERTESVGGIAVSPDGRWIVLNSHRGTAEGSLWLSDAGGPFQEVFRGANEVALAWFSGDRLLALTNSGAPNWRCVEIDPLSPAPDCWNNLIPESDNLLVDVAVSADRLLVHHLVSACSWISVHTLQGEFVGIVDLPPLATVTGLGADPSSSEVVLTVETFTRPATVLRVDPATGRFLPLGGLEPPAGFDHLKYPIRQVDFVSSDGTASKMFLVGRAAGGGKTVLTGYGGFNLARTPTWTPTIVPFLEAGGLYAVATLRGGSEYGERWHRAGMLGSKQNTFDDFIAAAEKLIDDGLCTPATLGIRGGSNGGLLVGAALTQRPELFGAAVCQVPLLDMVRYERFRIAELWNREYGTVADPEQFRWLHAYSPYHRVRRGTHYPPLLLLTAEDDARVDPSHACKFAALLQAEAPDGLTLLRVDGQAGHGQGKPVHKLLAEEVDIWSFLLHHLQQ